MACVKGMGKTPEIIKAAIPGFEAQRRSIDETDHRTPGHACQRMYQRNSSGPRMAEAQRKRWAESRKQPEPPSQGPKRKLSCAGKSAIVAATKRRWALKRAEAVKAQPAPAKKAAAKKSAPVKKAPKKKTAPTPEVAVA